MILFFCGYTSSLKGSKVNELTLPMGMSMLEGLYSCWMDDYISTGYTLQCVKLCVTHYYIIGCKAHG